MEKYITYNCLDYLTNEFLDIQFKSKIWYTINLIVITINITCWIWKKQKLINTFERYTGKWRIISNELLNEL